jgi:hypothetical protein
MAVDMSAKAVTMRLRITSQLRRLCLSLREAGIKTEAAEELQQGAIEDESEARPDPKVTSPAQ